MNRLSRATDPSLTPSNLTSALESLPDRLWKDFGKVIDVPQSTLDKIESQYHTDGKRKIALLRVYAKEHPQPTWERVSDALYRCKMGDKECHRTLDILQSKYPTVEQLTAKVKLVTALAHPPGGNNSSDSTQKIANHLNFLTVRASLSPVVMTVHVMS